MKKNFSVIFSAAFLLLTFAVVSNAQSDDASKSGESQKNNSQPKQTKGLKIKSKPVPSSRGCSEDSGIAILKVTFDKSAKVTDVIILRPSGCNVFDDNCLRAARAIKFEPQLKDGEPVTVTKQVEYNFQRLNE